jgi:hypothetical protein
MREERPESSPDGREELMDPGEELAGSGWVKTKVAAAALGVAPRTVRDYIRRGELAARSEGEGVERAWLVSVESLHELRRQRRGGSRAGEDLREVLASELVRGGPGGDVAAGAAAGPAARPLAPSDVEVLRELLLRLEARSAEAGDLRARLQLTERAESTLREELARERARADRLEAQLEEERGRSWWRRLIGR